jgi:hypothetical protein
MAVTQKVKKQDLEKKDLLAKIDRLFHIAPAKVKAEDGSGMVTVEHKIGKTGGAWTLRNIMEKLGFEDQHAEFIKDMIKQIKNPDERKVLIDRAYTAQKNRANRLVQDYRRHVEAFYGNYGRPLTPAMAFVPISDKESALFIQGLVVAETLELVVGEAEDVYRWTETMFTKSLPMAQLNHRSELQAKALMRHPAINKDLKQRLHAISQGHLPDKLGFGG